jgi:D-alanyl-lipoteichoic acid acyltransferase DltB (MBOAT superfamily)
LGLFKKLVLADNVAKLADVAFAQANSTGSLTSLEAFTGVLSYSLQIYLDFSAYSEMAIGLAALFNIQFPQNFNSPYRSLSIIDFWRRWHITLSRFLQKYLYIPLGGNRHGTFRKHLNLMITMLLGGLWHGANWTFVVWGGLHGLFLIVNHFSREVLKFTLPKPIAWVLTMMAVGLAWIFFRAENFTVAIAMIRSFKNFSSPEIIAAATSVENLSRYWVIYASVIWLIFEPRIMKFRDTWVYAGLVGLLGCLSLLCLGEEKIFIYFNF